MGDGQHPIYTSWGLLGWSNLESFALVDSLGFTISAITIVVSCLMNLKLKLRLFQKFYNIFFGLCKAMWAIIPIVELECPAVVIWCKTEVNFSWTGHYERPPYNDSTIRSVYHVREYDVQKLMQVEEPIDIFLSHDWPLGITDCGDWRKLVRFKPFFEKEVISCI